MAHKTTKQRQAERIASAAEDNPYATSFYNQLKEGEDKQKTAADSASPDFVGLDSNGVWVNNKFGNSQDRKDLRVEDIWGSPDFVNAYGDTWFTMTEAQRRAAAQSVLDSDQIYNKQGGLYFRDDAQAKTIMDAAIANANKNGAGTVNTNTTGTVQPTVTQTQPLTTTGTTTQAGYPQLGVANPQQAITQPAVTQTQPLMVNKPAVSTGLLGLGGQTQSTAKPSSITNGFLEEAMAKLKANQSASTEKIGGNPAFVQPVIDAGSQRRWRLGHNG